VYDYEYLTTNSLFIVGYNTLLVLVLNTLLVLCAKYLLVLCAQYCVMFPAPPLFSPSKHHRVMVQQGTYAMNPMNSRSKKPGEVLPNRTDFLRRASTTVQLKFSRSKVPLGHNSAYKLKKYQLLRIDDLTAILVHN